MLYVATHVCPYIKQQLCMLLEHIRSPAIHPIHQPDNPIHNPPPTPPTQKQLILLKHRPPIRYDVLSINLGITPDLAAIPGAGDYATPVKPIFSFVQRVDGLLARARESVEPPRIAVVGGGAGGVELALALAHRLKHERRGSKKEGGVEGQGDAEIRCVRVWGGWVCWPVCVYIRMCVCVRACVYAIYVHIVYICKCCTHQAWQYQYGHHLYHRSTLSSPSSPSSPPNRLITRGPILPTSPPYARTAILPILQQAGVMLLEGAGVRELQQNMIILDSEKIKGEEAQHSGGSRGGAVVHNGHGHGHNGYGAVHNGNAHTADGDGSRRVCVDEVLLCTQAAAPQWLRETGLPLGVCLGVFLCVFVFLCVLCLCLCVSIAVHMHMYKVLHTCICTC